MAPLLHVPDLRLPHLGARDGHLRVGRYDAAMSVFLTVILVLAMVGVLIALGVGVATMLKGGNPRRSNKMMQMRVLMQAVALVALALLMMTAASHH
jgi:NADH:ubiquinone oxidoreductase subunit 6 (subunit J)